jgi:hypothetical protein
VDEFKLKVQGISTTAEEARQEMAGGRKGPDDSPPNSDIIRFGG